MSFLILMYPRPCRAKNGVFSRREDNLGSLEPPGDVSSAKKSLELDKSSEFVAQTSLENGLEAFSRTDGSRILQKMHGTPHGTHCRMAGNRPTASSRCIPEEITFELAIGYGKQKGPRA